jgi:hypothetical protein
LQKKVLTDNLAARPLEPFKNMLKMHLPKRLLPLKLLQVMIFSWTLKGSGIDSKSQAEKGKQ